MEVLKPVGAYAVTAITAWLASRYHLDGNQTAAIASDLVGAGAIAYGVFAHYTAWKTIPPGGSNA